MPGRFISSHRLTGVGLKAWLLGACLLSSFSPKAQAQVFDLKIAESRIFELTNQLRQSQGLSKLQPLPALEQVARYHSQNMLNQGFFSHTDKSGRGPSARAELLFPGLFFRSFAENIAMNTGSSSTEDLAQRMFKQWKTSPGHYANMVNKSYLQLGVGLAAKGSAAYGTQVFGEALVNLEAGLPAEARLGETLKPTFEYLGNFPREELYFHLYVPDKQARFFTSSGSYYLGGGPLKISWLSDKRFQLELPLKHGKGEYRLGVGRNGSFSTGTYQVKAN